MTDFFTIFIFPVEILLGRGSFAKNVPHPSPGLKGLLIVMGSCHSELLPRAVTHRIMVGSMGVAML